MTVTIIPAYAGCEFLDSDTSDERFAIIAWQIASEGDSVTVRPISARGLELAAEATEFGGVYINGQIQ